MKKYFYLLSFCALALVYSCSRNDAGSSGDNKSMNDSAAQKAKSDSLINAANKMNAPADTVKKDSLTKPH